MSLEKFTRPLATELLYEEPETKTGNDVKDDPLMNVWCQKFKP